MTVLNDKTNLLGLTRAELDAFIENMGEKPFRARQLMKWLYKRHEGDFDKMTDLAKTFRERLKEVAEVRTPEITTDAGVGRRHAQVAARDGRRRRASRWCSSLSPVAARCAFRARSAARWTAPSVRPRSKVSIATSPSPKSSARCGLRIGSWAISPAAIASSRTSCSWAWASRSRTIATSCRPQRS